jgi:hypothetical protein
MFCNTSFQWGLCNSWRTPNTRDIWVTPEGNDALELKDNKIKLKDWEGYEYELDQDGKELSMKRPTT